MIYYLSTSPESKIVGWCYMGREKMADELGLTKQSILNLIQSLTVKGFVIKDDETSFLKTTRLWNVIYFTEGKESLPISQESLPTQGKLSLPNNNNLDINSNKSNSFEKEFPFYDETFLSTWKDYLKMRVSIKKKATHQAERLALKEVLKYSKGDKSTAIKIVEQSILNSWQGIFDIKQDKNLQLNFTGEISQEQYKKGASL